MDRGYIGRLSVYLVALLLLVQAPLKALQALKVFTATAVAAFWGLFVPVTSASMDISFAGFPMYVTLECTAIHYAMIFIAGVLAHHSYSMRYRLIGLCIGIPAIFVLNLLRIGLVGLVGLHLREYFEFIHEYLWQSTFALVVFMLWRAWMQESVEAVFSRHVAIALGAALLAALGLAEFMAGYAVILAWATSVLLRLLSFAANAPVRASPEGSMVGYALPGGMVYNKIETTVMSAVIFYAIAAWSVSRTRELRVLLRRVASGTLLMFVQHALLTAAFGILFTWSIDPDLFRGIHFFTVGLAHAAPLLTWFLVVLWFPGERDAPPAQHQDPRVVAGLEAAGPRSEPDGGGD